MLYRPDLIDARSPSGLEVFQLTTEAIPSCHLYTEAQVFAPDSTKFILHRSAHPHGSMPTDPEHQYLLCDLENDGLLVPVIDELGVTAPSVAPDGKHLYYFVDETGVSGGRFTLRRRKIDGTEREDIVVIDGHIPGTKFFPSSPYPLSTISSDSNRIATSVFLGDGRTPGIWGLLVFDIPSATVNLILSGPSWCNVHPQYSRSLDSEQNHDILVQENHGCHSNLSGEITRSVAGAGADIHVVRDDGLNFRDMPWGRDGTEFCQGHQCWRGRSEWAITSTGTVGIGQQLIESKAVEHIDHYGLRTPGGQRNDLSRTVEKPDFYHFATDIEGRRLISDSGPFDRTGPIYIADLGEPGVESLLNLTYLLSPKISWKGDMHSHPFLSPDGTTAYFNSDESGILQAYMIRNLPGV